MFVFYFSMRFRTLQINDEDDNRGFYHERIGKLDAVHIETCRDDLHNQRADNRADDGRASAGQSRSADDRCGDGVEFDVLSDYGCVRST